MCKIAQTKNYSRDFRQFNAMNNRLPGMGDAAESKKTKNKEKCIKT